MNGKRQERGRNPAEKNRVGSEKENDDVQNRGWKKASSFCWFQPRKPEKVFAVLSKIRHSDTVLLCKRIHVSQTKRQTDPGCLGGL